MMRIAEEGNVSSVRQLIDRSRELEDEDRKKVMGTEGKMES